MSDSNANKLGRGMAIILLTNIIDLIFSLVTNFALPKHLSYEAYATIKTFHLFVSYAGLFHLGYSDGIYLKYGGLTVSALDSNDAARSLSTMRVFQFATGMLLLIIGVSLSNGLLMVFSVYLIGYNLLGYFKNIFQAIGEFKRYAMITNIVAALNFVLNMTLVFIIKVERPYPYLISYTIVVAFAWLCLEFQMSNLLHIRAKLFSFSFSELIRNIKEGILLLFGNFTSILLTSMDRWFTKFLLTTVNFAQYSFAVSVENLLNVAITPITVTLYNYLCKNPEVNKIKTLKKYITIFAVFLVMAFFPVKFILEVYLVKYIDSITVIAFLFASQIFHVIIKSIYVNLYKAKLQQKKYFLEVVVVIVIGFAFNTVFFLVERRMESFAIGTFLSAFVWLVICENDFRDIRTDLTEALYLGFQTVTFLICATNCNSIIGLAIYLCVFLFTTFTLMRRDALSLMRFARQFANRGILRREE